MNADSKKTMLHKEDSLDGWALEVADGPHVEESGECDLDCEEILAAENEGMH